VIKLQDIFYVSRLAIAAVGRAKTMAIAKMAQVKKSTLSRLLI